MSFLIDTDIASDVVRQVLAVQARFLQYTGGLYLSVISLAELRFWLLRKNTPSKFSQELPVLLQQIHVLNVDDPVAQRAGEIGAELLDRGLPIATPDLLIAATALAHNLTLVTRNLQDYANIPGLTVVDWTVP